MKTYKAIMKDMQKNAQDARALNEAIKAEQDAEKVAEMCEKLAELHLVGYILKDNFAHTLAAAGLEALKEIAAKYDGKPCGEITEKTISKEMRKRGFGFYFHRSMWGKDSDSATIYAVLENGGYFARNEEGLIYSPCIVNEDGERRRIDFITTENKINYAAIAGADIGGKYCDSPAKKAREILKARRKYAKAIEAAQVAQDELNHILPHRVDHFNNVSSRYIREF